MQHHQEMGKGGVGATFLVNYRCHRRLRHVVARWTRSPAAQPQGRAQGAVEGAVLEHVGIVNGGRGKRVSEGAETLIGERGGGSPWMMAMRGWSPRMMAAQHVEARLESTDDGDEVEVSTDDGGVARGGAVRVHGRWRRRGGGLNAKFWQRNSSRQKNLWG
jgi:hypothetical protein